MIAYNAEFQGYPFKMRILRILSDCTYIVQYAGAREFSAPPQPQVLLYIMSTSAFMFTLLSTEYVYKIYMLD
jgi:hypothetical protein